MPHLDEGVLVAFVDGEIDAAARTAVDEHLASCEDCRSRLAELQGTRDRARAILRSSAPAGTRPDFARVLARRRASRPGFRTRPLAWAATIVLAIGIGWYAREMSAPAPADRTVAVVPQAPPAPAANPTAAPAAKASRDTPLAQVAVATPAAPAAPAAPRRVPPPNADEARDVRSPADIPAHARAAQVAMAPEAREKAAPASAAAERAPAPAALNGLRRLDSTGTSVTRAREVLGRAPLAVPGLRVLSYDVQGSRVIVTQELPNGARLELTEQRALAASGNMAKKVEGAHLQDAAIPAVVVEGIEVRATGPVTPDSLGALLRRVR